MTEHPLDQEQLDASHIRCLEAIFRAEAHSREVGEWEITAERAQRPANQRVQAAADAYPSPIIKRLETLWLIDASISWDGHTRVTGLTTFGETVLCELHEVELSDNWSD